jgi:hypothetical protein
LKAFRYLSARRLDRIGNAPQLCIQETSDRRGVHLSDATSTNDANTNPSNEATPPLHSGLPTSRQWFRETLPVILSVR